MTLESNDLGSSLLPTKWMILRGVILYLYLPPFPHLKNGGNKGTNFTWLSED